MLSNQGRTALLAFLVRFGTSQTLVIELSRYYGHKSAEGEEEGRAVTGEPYYVREPSGTEEKTATTRGGSHRRT